MPPDKEQLAGELAPALLSRPALVRLYLTESRAVGPGAGQPLRRLADFIGRRAVELTRIGRTSGLFDESIPATVSALTVVGAAERIALAYLVDEAMPPPDVAARALVKLVLDGLRATPPPDGRA